MSRVGLSSQCCAPGRGESGAPRSSCNGTAGFWVRQGDGSQDGGRNGPSHNTAVPLLIALIISRQTAPDWAEVFPDRSHWGKRVYSGSFLNRRTVHYTNAMFSFTSTRQNVFWKTFFFCSNIVRRIWLNPLMKTTSFVSITVSIKSSSCAGIAVICQPWFTSQAYKMAALAAIVNWTVQTSALWMSYTVGSQYSSWRRPPGAAPPQAHSLTWYSPLIFHSKSWSRRTRPSRRLSACAPLWNVPRKPFPAPD